MWDIQIFNILCQCQHSFNAAFNYNNMTWPSSIRHTLLTLQHTEAFYVHDVLSQDFRCCEVMWHLCGGRGSARCGCTCYQQLSFCWDISAGAERQSDGQVSVSAAVCGFNSTGFFHLRVWIRDNLLPVATANRCVVGSL